MANESSGMGKWMTGSSNSGGGIYPNAATVECTHGCIPCRDTHHCYYDNCYGIGRFLIKMDNEYVNTRFSCNIFFNLVRCLSAARDCLVRTLQVHKRMYSVLARIVQINLCTSGG